jgi:hypothetical protein
MKVETDLLTKLRADSDFASTHNSERAMLEKAYGQVWKQNGDANVLKDRVSRYHNDFLVRARRAIGPIVQPILQGATAKAVAHKTATKPQAQARPQQHSPSQQAPQASPSSRKNAYSVLDDDEFKSFFRPTR